MVPTCLYCHLSGHIRGWWILETRPLLPKIKCPRPRGSESCENRWFLHCRTNLIFAGAKFKSLYNMAVLLTMFSLKQRSNKTKTITYMHSVPLLWCWWQGNSVDVECWNHWSFQHTLCINDRLLNGFTKRIWALPRINYYFNTLVKTNSSSLWFGQWLLVN